MLISRTLCILLISLAFEDKDGNDDNAYNDNITDSNNFRNDCNDNNGNEYIVIEAKFMI